ncbi:hypothetical protein SAMN05192559_102440 [Halobacillus karajensis]|uniref:Uncharacterized protein n=1 Tax=Halobacillus karajensis TaxID=195088 RepID=A0A024P782_9BACI|nr:hypothetical protein [Halobacillus karajensis]CDQ17769.1 hypothetical protein BN982_00006 [Halobacillus karajensis]CDQ24177.1 hypothetical protein BN983_02445 [Halobacillus karajensis]CDQ29576.1 hypothetical protein BN981_03960 [Halobacillus karajensis]SEH64274.1 hypothetical protein SAMN05192559_102440 [Halobacillus karajensis]
MKIKGTILLGLLLSSVLTGCAVNEQEEPKDVNFQPTRYEQDDQRNRLDRDNGEDTRPDVDYPIIDRENEEIDFGDREIELDEGPLERNNNDNNRGMDE